MPLSAHFAATRAPIDDYDVVSLALRIPAEAIAERVAVRVDQQFARGVVDEVKGMLASGVPAEAHPFTGLVYRQVLEYPPRRPRRGRDARADRAGEPPICAPPVDLVPERA